MRQKARLAPLWRHMKSPKNIKKYFKEIIKLTNEIEIDNISNYFIDHYKELKEFHYENVDLRFSQVICTKIQHIVGYWFYKEDEDILIELGVEPRKVLVWGQNFNKDLKRLRRTKWRLICNLDTEHIEAILKGEFVREELYVTAFKAELEFRKKK